MNIHSTRGQAMPYHKYPKYQAPDSPHHVTFARLDDYTPSTGQKIAKTVGGGFAGGLYTAVLAALPISLIPALGGTPGLAGTIYGATIATGALTGALASGTMPPGKDWY